MPLPLLPLLPTIAAALTAGALAPSIGEEVKKVQRNIDVVYGSPQAREEALSYLRAVKKEGREAQLQQLAQSGFSQRVGEGGFVSQLQDVLPTRSIRQEVLVGGFKPVYRELLNRGYSQKEAERVANAIVQQEASRESASLGAVLNPEVAANVVAGGIGARVLPRAASLTPGFVQRNIFRLPGFNRLTFLQNPVATATGRIAGRAGVIEGTTAVVSEDVSRRQFGQQESGLTTGALGLEPGSIPSRAVAQTERVLIGGIAGAIVAKPLGFVIGGQSIPRPRVSKLYQVTGDIIDLPEYPGDKLTDWASQKLKVPKNRVRIVAFQPTQVNPLTGTTTPGQAAVAVVPSETTMATNEPFVSTTAQTSLDNIFGKSNINDPVPPPPVDDPVPPPPPPVDDPVPPPPSPVDEPVQNNVTTNTTTLADVFAEVPAKSNIYRGGLPFLPIAGMPGGGYRGPVYRSRAQYINELRLTQRLVGNMFSRNVINQPRNISINSQRKQIRKFLRVKGGTKPLTEKEKRRYYELTGVRL